MWKALRTVVESISTQILQWLERKVTQPENHSLSASEAKQQIRKNTSGKLGNPNPHLVSRWERQTSPITILPKLEEQSYPQEKTEQEHMLRVAARIWRRQEELRKTCIIGSRSLKLTPDRLKRVTTLLNNGYSEEDCNAVLENVANEVRKDPSVAKWFNGTTTWIPGNFERMLGQIGASGDAPAAFVAKIREDKLKGVSRPLINPDFRVKPAPTVVTPPQIAPAKPAGGGESA